MGKNLTSHSSVQKNQRKRKSMEQASRKDQRVTNHTPAFLRDAVSIATTEVGQRAEHVSALMVSRADRLQKRNASHSVKIKFSDVLIENLDHGFDVAVSKADAKQLLIKSGIIDSNGNLTENYLE